MFKHGLDRRTACHTWTVLCILLLFAIIYLIRETLFVFALALLFAYLIWPGVHYLDRRLPGQSRVPALAIVYLSLVALLVIVGIAIGSRVVLEANALALRIPELLSRLEKPAALIASPSLPTFKETVISMLQNQFVAHSRDLLSLLPNLAICFLSHAGSLIYIVLVPILGFFFLKDGPHFHNSLLLMLSEGSRRDEIGEIAADVHMLLAQYMRALVLLASAVFVAYGLFLSHRRSLWNPAGRHRLPSRVHSSFGPDDCGGRHFDCCRIERLSASPMDLHIPEIIPSVSRLRLVAAPAEQRRETTPCDGHLWHPCRRSNCRDSRQLSGDTGFGYASNRIPAAEKEDSYLDA